MVNTVESRRVLLVAQTDEEQALRQAFAHRSLSGWEALAADSFERARFILQHNACDLLLVDESLCYGAGPDGLGWLARQEETALVCLCGSQPEILTHGYMQGAQVCLPRHLAVEHPPLLAAALQRARQLGEVRRSWQRTKDKLHESRRQVDRLVG